MVVCAGVIQGFDRISGGSTEHGQMSTTMVHRRLQAREACHAQSQSLSAVKESTRELCERRELVGTCM